jgi:hypothetical protein
MTDMPTSSELVGGCLCGKIRYTVTSTPTGVSICNCRHCRKQSGSHRSLNWLVPVGALAISGELKTFEDRGDSGGVVLRQFCPDCGSPIRTIAASMPGFEILKSGTLDETPPDTPRFAIFVARAAKWEMEALECPKYELNRS